MCTPRSAPHIITPRPLISHPFLLTRMSECACACVCVSVFVCVCIIPPPTTIASLYLTFIHACCSGRFETNTRLCLSMSDFHPETWNPMWSLNCKLECLYLGMLVLVCNLDAGVCFTSLYLGMLVRICFSRCLSLVLHVCSPHLLGIFSILVI
jgi:hypothetical protein